MFAKQYNMFTDSINCIFSILRSFDPFAKCALFALALARSCKIGGGGA